MNEPFICIECGKETYDNAGSGWPICRTCVQDINSSNQEALDDNAQHYVIVCLGLPIPPFETPWDGCYLREYDPDGDRGRGRVVWTRDRNSAMQFINSAAATSCWQQVSTVRPTRPDGKPNRPLTAFTVTVQPVE